MIQLRSGDVPLSAGDLFVIPRRVEHCPLAAEEVHFMVIGPEVTSTAAGGKPSWSYGSAGAETAYRRLTRASRPSPDSFAAGDRREQRSGLQEERARSRGVGLVSGTDLVGPPFGANRPAPVPHLEVLMTVPTTAAATTQAQVVDTFGGPDRFRSAVLPLPAPAAGQVQLRVVAAGINPVDLSTRAGLNIPVEVARFPMVLGWDAAGTITAVGDGVTGCAVGDRVAAMTFQPMDQNGTYVRDLNLAADLVARVPDGLTLEQAATVPLVGLVAAQLVQWIDLPAGATLVINGPVGAVGRIVVALAVRNGITVVAVAAAGDRDAARGLGATEVVDRGNFSAAVRDLHPGGADAAIDLVGGAAARAALDSVRDGGAYASLVPLYIDPTGPQASERGIRFEMLAVHPDTPVLTDLLTAAARGDLSTAIETTYPLSQAAAAHRRQTQGHLRGKILLLP